MDGIASPTLVGDYFGCYGRAVFDAAETSASFRCCPAGERPMLPEMSIQAVQWVRHGSAATMIQPAPQEALLLHGPVTGPVTVAWARRIASALKEGRYADLARLPGELAGCLATPRRVFLFRSAANDMEGLLYRRSGSLFRWSTDPVDLLDEGGAELDREAIWRCCRGEDAFIYRNITPVLPGQVVVADHQGTTTVSHDHITPIELPRRTTLPEYAELAHELILRAVRPLASQGKVGLILSGGLDSAVVLSALAEVGADTVAYHWHHPALGEYAYAKAACDHVGVPLVPIPLDVGEGYLSPAWRFSHPFAHMGFRGWEQTADRARDDGLAFVAWGRDGDTMFGPMRYGLHTILAGDLPWREKVALCRGLVCSGWPLPSLVKSIRPSYSLLDEEVAGNDLAQPVDFLTPMPGTQNINRVCFQYVAQEHTLNLALWWPRGIQLFNPLGSRDIQRLAGRMPHAYRMLPHQGRLITKPVLRLILASRLPDAVWRRYGRGWFEMPHKEYAVANYRQLAELIGHPGSHLVELGVVDPGALEAVLSDRRQRQRHTVALICSAMVELFLRSYHERSHPKPAAVIPLAASRGR